MTTCISIFMTYSKCICMHLSNARNQSHILCIFIIINAIMLHVTIGLLMQFILISVSCIRSHHIKVTCLNLCTCCHLVLSCMAFHLILYSYVTTYLIFNSMNQSTFIFQMCQIVWLQWVAL